jgi:alpha-pyrone synthase
MTKVQQSVNQCSYGRGKVPVDHFDNQRPSVTKVLPRINALATAAPDHDIHTAFIDWAGKQLTDRTQKAIFARMAKRSGIEHRYSVLPIGPGGGSPVQAGGYYATSPLPSTAARMATYRDYAPPLALRAVAGLEDALDPGAVTHLVVASCTGFVAPGIDQIIARQLGLSPSVERVLIGFMGCYAAVTALRTARHIVRSDPAATVLVITVELSTLHLQSDADIEPLLAMLHFGDGAAAALVSARGRGLALEDGLSLTLPASEDLIRWTIGDEGFAMHLSGAVPARIEAALGDETVQAQICGALSKDDIKAWAVHAGGRSILDAVERGLDLENEALAVSRQTLLAFGNMSSSTLMFTLASMIKQKPETGVALAFGPGLAAEGIRFGWTDGDA